MSTSEFTPSYFMVGNSRINKFQSIIVNSYEEIDSDNKENGFYHKMLIEKTHSAIKRLKSMISDIKEQKKYRITPISYNYKKNYKRIKLWDINNVLKDLDNAEKYLSKASKAKTEKGFNVNYRIARRYLDRDAYFGILGKYFKNKIV